MTASIKIRAKNPICTASAGISPAKAKLHWNSHFCAAHGPQAPPALPYHACPAVDALCVVIESEPSGRHLGLPGRLRYLLQRQEASLTSVINEKQQISPEKIYLLTKCQRHRAAESHAEYMIWLAADPGRLCNRVEFCSHAQRFSTASETRLCWKCSAVLEPASTEHSTTLNGSIQQGASASIQHLCTDLCMQDAAAHAEIAPCNRWSNDRCGATAAASDAYV